MVITNADLVQLLDYSEPPNVVISCLVAFAILKGIETPDLKNANARHARDPWGEGVYAGFTWADVKRRVLQPARFAKLVTNRGEEHQGVDSLRMVRRRRPTQFPM